MKYQHVSQTTKPSLGCFVKWNSIKTNEGEKGGRLAKKEASFRVEDEGNKVERVTGQQVV